MIAATCHLIIAHLLNPDGVAAINVHPNALNPNKWQLEYGAKRLTHKQQIALQTATDSGRFGVFLDQAYSKRPYIFPGYIRSVRIMQTAKR